MITDRMFMLCKLASDFVRDSNLYTLSGLQNIRVHSVCELREREKMIVVMC